MAQTKTKAKADAVREEPGADLASRADTVAREIFKHTEKGAASHDIEPRGVAFDELPENERALRTEVGLALVGLLDTDAAKLTQLQTDYELLEKSAEAAADVVFPIDTPTSAVAALVMHEVRKCNPDAVATDALELPDSPDFKAAIHARFQCTIMADEWLLLPTYPDLVKFLCGRMVTAMPTPPPAPPAAVAVEAGETSKLDSLLTEEATDQDAALKEAIAFLSASSGRRGTVLRRFIFGLTEDEVAAGETKPSDDDVHEAVTFMGSCRDVGTHQNTVIARIRQMVK